MSQYVQYYILKYTFTPCKYCYTHTRLNTERLICCDVLKRITMHTFGYVIVHHEFKVFTTPDHSHGVPLVVIQLLASVQDLRALA